MADVAGSKEAARWLNKLYNEGLAADLTVDRTLHGQMAINGQTAIIPWAMHSPIFVGYGDFYNKMVQHNPDAKLEPIFPWTKDTGLPYWNELWGNPGYGLGFITPSYTKHPQQVVQYLDYLASDLGRQTMILGVEGQDWKNALPNILVASPEEFDALWDAAIKAFRDNGGDAVAAEAVANYQQWTSQ